MMSAPASASCLQIKNLQNISRHRGLVLDQPWGIFLLDEGVGQIPLVSRDFEFIHKLPCCVF